MRERGKCKFLFLVLLLCVVVVVVVVAVVVVAAAHLHFGEIIHSDDDRSKHTSNNEEGNTQANCSPLMLGQGGRN